MASYESFARVYDLFMEIVSVNKRVLYIRAAFLLPSVRRDNGEKRKKFWYLPENNDKITFCERV